MTTDNLVEEVLQLLPVGDSLVIDGREGVIWFVCRQSEVEYDNWYYSKYLTDAVANVLKDLTGQPFLFTPDIENGNVGRLSKLAAEVGSDIKLSKTDYRWTVQYKNRYVIGESLEYLVQKLEFEVANTSRKIDPVA